MNENINEENIDFLDMLNIASFMAQIENMSEDEKQNKYIHKVIKAIAVEIDKLHKENDIIMEQNERIIEILLRE